MVRRPVVSGQFYPGSANELRKMIKSLVQDEASKIEVVGLISPHAGYIYSGAVAAATISRIEFKDTFIILGPNHTGAGSPFALMKEGFWETPLGRVEIDSELAQGLLDESDYLSDDPTAHQYEHSIEVQLPFLQYFKPDVKIVPITLAHAPGTIFKELGKSIAKVVKKLGREAIILASSDMTHYEPQQSAEKKDREAIEAILSLDEDELLRRIDSLGISMCGYGPATSLISAAKELRAGEAELIKYQTSGDISGDYSSVVGYAGIIIKKAEMHPVVRLAKEAVETYIKEGKVIKAPSELAPEMRGRAGVFVSIHKFGELRGCIGTFEPSRENIAEEIIANAISSATRDPRFLPIAPGELKDLEYSVDILSSPEPVESKEELDPKKYGVIVESGPRRGLLLPDLEGVDSVDQQIEICRYKAGIDPSEPVKLYRFTVKRYK